jgi:putative transposase
MLCSYTNAINKQQKRSGLLFRKNTKAEYITCPDGIEPPYYMVKGITQIKMLKPAGKQYPQLCFD